MYFVLEDQFTLCKSGVASLSFASSKLGGYTCYQFICDYGGRNNENGAKYIVLARAYVLMSSACPVTVRVLFGLPLQHSSSFDRDQGQFKGQVVEQCICLSFSHI